MDLKLDENLPVECLSQLRKAGHDVLSVRDQDLVGATDAELASKCAEERRVLVSLDLDFADIRTFTPSEYSGIVVFRLAFQDRDTMMRIVDRLIGLLQRQSPQRQLWIVEEDRVRIRE